MAAEPVPEAENDAVKRLREFLVEDYKLKVGYLIEHFSRMWTRFNFFLSLETLVAGVLVAAATTDKTLDNLWPVALLGLVISACWYLVGITDRYLIAVYRSQIRATLLEMARNRVFDLANDTSHVRIGTLQLLENPLDCYRTGKTVDDDFRYPYTGSTKPMEDIKTNWSRRQPRGLSVTTWAAAFPVLAIVLWSGLLIGKIVGLL